MNQRIKEISVKASFPEWSNHAIEFELEKFAELIVKECIAQCEKNAGHEWLGAGSKLSAFNIKEHFGVKE